jgi:predicted AAA+ superfamily ATPase
MTTSGILGIIRELDKEIPLRTPAIYRWGKLADRLTMSLTSAGIPILIIQEEDCEMSTQEVAAILGGPKALRREVRTHADFISIIREGLPTRAVRCFWRGIQWRRCKKIRFLAPSLENFLPFSSDTCYIDRMLKRLMKMDLLKEESFFLWGARQTGKTSYLKEAFPNSVRFDLLESNTFAQFVVAPHKLREIIRALPSRPKRVIIDEVQKVPALLDEIHLLIEEDKIPFGLCGSSARKLKRGHANLLGGRALRFVMTGLSGYEIPDFDLVRILNTGYLPRHYLNPHRAQDYLLSYVSDYLKEEIAAEGLVRNLPNFHNFLQIAALSDTELVSFSTIARDIGISSQTVKDYFDILVDTHVGHWLQPWRKRLKRKTVASPKFYFDDVGVVGLLTKRRGIEPGSELFGKAFENWIFHELFAWQSYCSPHTDLTYWRSSENTEVDFIIGDLEVAIEAKGSQKISSNHLHGLRQLKKDYKNCNRQILVCLESVPRITEDGIEILPYVQFLKLLWQEGLDSAGFRKLSSPHSDVP